MTAVIFQNTFAKLIVMILLLTDSSLKYIKVMAGKPPISDDLSPNNGVGHERCQGNCRVSHEKHIQNQSQQHLMQGAVLPKIPNFAMEDKKAMYLCQSKVYEQLAGPPNAQSVPILYPAVHTWWILLLSSPYWSSFEKC